MAQITVFGYVAENLVPKQSQKETAYVCFQLREYMGKGRWQTYQVWAWGSIVARMERLGIKEGSLIWLTGSLELVDATIKHGREKTKLLKVYCSDVGYLPRPKRSKQDAENETAAVQPECSPPPETLDGDRMQLPE